MPPRTASIAPGAVGWRYPPARKVYSAHASEDATHGVLRAARATLDVEIEGDRETTVNFRIGVSDPEKRRQVPTAVWGEPSPIKDATYDSLMLDRRLPHSAEPANHWLADGPSSGYTPGYFKELSSEVRVEERTRAGRRAHRWDLRKCAAGRNEAWDYRVYARAAAMALVWPRPLVDGLAALADASPVPDGNVVEFREESKR